MEHLGFVLWMVTYPLVGSLSRYLSVKMRVLGKLKQYTEANFSIDESFDIIIWISVGYLLW
jgi:hypothetical protein